MGDQIQTADEIFNGLSEETFNALIIFMRLSPEERKEVFRIADELTANE